MRWCSDNLIRVLATLALIILLSACDSSNNDDDTPLDDNPPGDQPIDNDPPDDQPINDDSSPPAMPMELTGTVYSTHEIELFWKPSTDDGWVMGYDIYRDDVLLAEQLDVNSFFDDTVEPDTEYTYKVIAVDDDGNRSSPASLILNTPAVTKQPQINRNNFAALLSHVFSIYVGDLYNEPLIALSEFNIQGRNPDGSFKDVHNCETGEYSQSLDPSSTLSGVGFTFDFNSCFENGVTYDGMLSGRNSAYAETLNFESGISLQTHPDLKTSYSGSGTFNTSMSRNDTRHQWEAVGMTVNSRTIDGSLQLDSVNSTFGYGSTGGSTYEAWLNGGFNVRSDATSGSLLIVDTPVGLSYECNPRAEQPCNFRLPHQWAFTSGQLELIAEDGSRLLLDANTSTQESANITITNPDGDETFEALWSQWQPLLSFKRFSADASDWVSAQSVASAELDARPAIRTDNYEALLEHVFNIVTGYSGYEALSEAQYFIDHYQPTETSRASGVRTDNYDCETSGTATARRVDNDQSIYPLDYRLAFEQCEFGEYQFDGNMRGQENRLNGGVLGIEDANLHWLDGDGNDHAFKGQSSAQQTGDGADTVCSWNAEQISLHSQSETESESVITGHLNVDVNGSVATGITAFISGSLAVASEITEGFEIAVIVTDLEITNIAGAHIGEWTISKGEIFLSAYDKSNRWSSDRSTLTYIAGVSNIEIINTEGSNFVGPWTSWQTHAQPALERICGEES